MQLAGKRVLITGGNRGIGFELAKALAQRGARIAICGRDKASLQRAAETIGPQTIAIMADLAEPDACKFLTSEVLSAFGGLDILVNNAAVQMNYSFFGRDTSSLQKDIAREWEINFAGPAKLIATLIPALAQSGTERNGSAIVNMGSGLALAPKRDAAIYCASKAALRNFSRSLRYQAEEAAPGLRVLDVTLPLVNTDMTQGRGRGKIEPAKVARDVVHALETGRDDVLVGKARLFAWIMRLAPAIGYRMLRG